MEWNQVERQIESQLEQREIHPAAGLWDELDRELNKSRVKSRKKAISAVFAVAATVCLLVFGGYFFFDAPASLQPAVDTWVDVQPEAMPLSTDENQAGEEVLSPTVKSLAPSGQIATTQTAVRKVKTDQKTAVAESTRVNRGEEAPELSQLIHADLILQTRLDTVLVAALRPSKPVAIDAELLLNEVESELRETYKETFFKQVKRNLIEAKTAFSNRNSQ